MRTVKTAKDWGALMLLVLFWGSSFAITKLALNNISAEWIVFLRLFVSTLILIPLVYFSDGGLPKGLRIWLWYLGLAAIGVLLPFLLITTGMNAIDSSLAAILIATTPLFALLLSHIFLADEKMDQRKTIGFIVGFIGIVILMEPESLLAFSLHKEKLGGQIAILAAAILYAAHMVTSRFLKGTEPIQTMTGMSLVATVLSFGYACVVAPQGLDHADAASLTYTVLLGIFPTAIAGVILYKMLRETGVRFVSLSNYLLPIVGLLIGTIFLGEVVHIWMLIGMGLVVFGIWVSEFGKTSKPKGKV